MTKVQPRRLDLSRWATVEETVLYIMEKRGCDREEAEEVLERFMVEHPESCREAGSA